jgi:hypothetical protein
MSRVGFEPTILASERAKIVHARHLRGLGLVIAVYPTGKREFSQRINEM